MKWKDNKFLWNIHLCSLSSQNSTVISTVKFSPVTAFAHVRDTLRGCVDKKIRNLLFKHACMIKTLISRHILQSFSRRLSAKWSRNTLLKTDQCRLVPLETSYCRILLFNERCYRNLNECIIDLRPRLTRRFIGPVRRTSGSGYFPGGSFPLKWPRVAS